MNMPLLREFRLSSRNGIGVRCGADGAFVGATPLLEHVDDAWAPRDIEELSNALGETYGLPVDASAKHGGLAAVAKALNERDVARARIATLFLHFPDPLPLAKGASSQGEIVTLAVALDWAGLLKFDSEHYPAGPKGGQFAPKGEGGAPSMAADADAGRSASDAPAQDIVTGSSVVFARPLTADEFVAWLAAQQRALGPPNPSVDTFDSDEASASAGGPKDKSGPDFQAPAELDAFVKQIAGPLSELKLVGTNDVERYVTIGVNGVGQYVVSSLKIMGALGGRPGDPPDGTVAIAHTHPRNAISMPENRDDAWAIDHGTSSFVIARNGSYIWEIGRNDGAISIRTISADPPGPWEAFQRDWREYRTYRYALYP